MTTFKRYTGTDWEYINLPTFNSGPAATLAYAQVTANQTGITTEVDIVGLSVTVVVPEGRRLKISTKGRYQTNTAGAGAALAIHQDGVQINQFSQTTGETNISEEIYTETVVSPSAGSHTYKIRMSNFNGGTALFGAAPTVPGFILVEDVTGSTLPYNAASVPVGQLAYAQATANQGTFTAETDLTGLSVNISVPAGRVIEITGHCEMSSSVADGTMRLSIFEGATLINIGEQNGSTNAQGVEVSAVISPSAGSHTYKLSGLRSAGTGNLTMAAGPTFPAYILVKDITPTPAPGTGAPSSTLGYAEVTASQSGITAVTDLTGLSSTINVPAGRRIKITAKVAVNGSVASNTAALQIQEGATVLQNIQIQNSTTPGNGTTEEGEVIITPSAGMHTYKLTLQLSAGGGTVGMAAASTFPAFILVEDITGAIWPDSSPVTVGLFASEQWIDFVPTITQGVALTKTITYARYQKLGRIVHAQVMVTITSAGTVSNPVFISLPVPPANTHNGPCGSGLYQDTGTTIYSGTSVITSTGVALQSTAQVAYVGQAPSFAAANTDLVGYNITYEAAS